MLLHLIFALVKLIKYKDHSVHRTLIARIDSDYALDLIKLNCATKTTQQF